MDEAEDIVGISFFFTFGVILAALAAGTHIGYAATAASTASAAAAMYFLYSRSCGKRILWLLGFSLIGISCFCTQFTVCFGVRDSDGSLLPGVLDGFCSFIDSLPFAGENTAPLLKALLSGRRTALDSATVGAFRSSGASHILALSGLHLGIIYGILTKLLAFAGKSRAVSVLKAATVVAACGIYAAVAGFGPSLTRAFLFITLNELSKLSGERSHSPAGIYCTALTIQLIFDPMAVRTIGFQLSYLAMAGIFLIYLTLEKWYPSYGSRTADKLSPARRIWNSMALSISCQLTTAPLVWLRFHSFPKYFLLTNLMALPLTEALVLSGILTLLLSAAGICPDLTIRLTDALADALVGCLETISSM